MDPPSGQAKAGRILLLIGAVLAAVGAAFLALAGLFLLAAGETFLGEEAEQSMAPTVIGAIYLVVAALVAVGCVFGFLAYGRAMRGDVHGAWVFGLVAALVPPVQLLALVGAILLLTSPEHEAVGRGATS